jgi:acetyltransferase-like isoleucine patch superfamily enzyme
MHLGERYYTEDELRLIPFKQIGNGVKIKRTAGLFFVENICIGDNTRIDDFSIIVASREAVKLGSHVHIASHCYISGSDGFCMEDFSGLSPGVLIFTSSDDYTGTRMTNPTVPKCYRGGPAGPVTLERHVIIGAGTVILPNVRIGIGSSVGAHSLVNKSLEPWGIHFGSPAKRIRDRSRHLLDLENELINSNKNSYQP